MRVLKSLEFRPCRQLKNMETKLKYIINNILFLEVFSKVRGISKMMLERLSVLAIVKITHSKNIIYHGKDRHGLCHERIHHPVKQPHKQKDK